AASEGRRRRAGGRRRVRRPPRLRVRRGVRTPETSGTDRGWGPGVRGDRFDGGAAGRTWAGARRPRRPFRWGSRRTDRGWGPGVRGDHFDGGAAGRTGAGAPASEATISTGEPQDGPGLGPRRPRRPFRRG